MAANMPSSLPSFSNPTGSNYLNSPAHATQHANANDEIVAIATKVGIDGSAVNTTLDYKISSISAGDKAVSLAGTQTLTGIKTVAAVVQTVTSLSPSASGTATCNLSLGNVFLITMPAGNITIAISNGVAGQYFSIEILQDSVGSRTVTWFSTIKWAGGVAPTLTTTASKKDTFAFRMTSAGNYDGFVVGQSI